MVNLSEKETREKYIDPILKDERGWREGAIFSQLKNMISAL